MSALDLINSGLVSLAVAAAYGDVLQLKADRVAKGMKLSTGLLLTVWPLWDLFYYHSLAQWLSMTACVLLAGLRATWLFLAVKYARSEQEQ